MGNIEKGLLGALGEKKRTEFCRVTSIGKGGGGTVRFQQPWGPEKSRRKGNRKKKEEAGGLQRALPCSVRLNKARLRVYGASRGDKKKPGVQKKR